MLGNLLHVRDDAAYVPEIKHRSIHTRGNNYD